MTPRTENKLRLAWFGPMSAAVVGARHHVTPRTVRRFWADEKAAGRLPDGPRPHFVDCTVDPGAAADAAIDATADMALDREIACAETSPDDPMDPRYATAIYGCRVPEGDPLLAALKREHGNDPRRRFDDVGSNDRSKVPGGRRLVAQRLFRDGAMVIVAKHPQRFAERAAP